MKLRLLTTLACLLLTGCGLGNTPNLAQPDRPSAEQSANLARRQQRDQMEYMQRRAEYERQLNPALRRYGQEPAPPPPDPANTQPFVPPPMDIQGTPAALQAPDAWAELERIYEDSDYGYLTRNVDASLKPYSDKLVVDGKPFDRAQQTKFFKEQFQDITELEAEVGQTLRSGSKTEILKLTPKGPDKLAAHVRCTERLMASAVDFQDVYITETRHLWIKEKGQWKIVEETTLKEEHHTYRDGQEITED